MTTLFASASIFGLVIFTAMAGVALAAVILAVLIVRDWRQGKLW